MRMENIKEIERERKRMEARVFKWFGYVSLRPQDVAQWATSLLYSLFDIFGWLQCVVRCPIYT
jgi:hypothetical protein